MQGRHVASDDDRGELADGQLSSRQIGSIAPGLVLDSGAEDDKHPDYHRGPRGPPVQRRLCELVDSSVAAGLKAHFDLAEASLDVARLEDLACKGTAHGWLWALSPHQGPVIEDDQEFVEAVRVRLGAGGPPDGGLCGHCGRSQLDRPGGHASCCAIGEANKGHDAIRDVVFEFASVADPATEWEPEDLVPSRPRARPTDVLTPAAIPGRVAALDIGVTSPASAPGGDAAEAMFSRKVAERESQRAELEAQNIIYRPMVWTSFGRPYSATTPVLTSLAKRVARKRGRTSTRAILRQIHQAIGVCIARRAARMSLACWPRAGHTDFDRHVAERIAANFDGDISRGLGGSEMWF